MNDWVRIQFTKKEHRYQLAFSQPKILVQLLDRVGQSDFVNERVCDNPSRYAQEMVQPFHQEPPTIQNPY